MEAEKKGLANPRLANAAVQQQQQLLPGSTHQQQQCALTSGKGDVKALPAAGDAAANGTVDRAKGGKGAADSKGGAGRSAGGPGRFDLVFIAPKTWQLLPGFGGDECDCWVGCDAVSAGGCVVKAGGP